MPLIEPKKEITTSQPFLMIPAGLQPGRYVFQLVVVDESGMRSAPTRRLVTIQQHIVKPPIPVNPALPHQLPS